jgi:hypothetical protein
LTIYSKSCPKTYELRVNDRGYKVGDLICLFEWDPKTELYGRKALVKVGYLTPGGSFGLPDNMCIMAIEVLAKK